MTERCKSCKFWDAYKGSGDEIGDCRRFPPRISETLLARMLPGGSANPLDELERSVYDASPFPVTHGDSACGEYDNGCYL